MKFRRSGPTILIATAAVVIVSITILSNLLASQMLSAAEDGQFRLMRDVLASIQKSTEEKALVRAELVTSMPAVRSAFIARDRPRLLRECQEMFREQSEKYGLDQSQFHVPPGISFLRLHKPEMFGDDQTSYRPMLADVNANRVRRKGVVVSKFGPVITGIVPIADDAGNHVGSFEMGLDLAPMLDKIKEAYRLEAAVFIDEKLLREIATGLTGDVLTEKNRVGKYIRFHATHPELLKALVTDREVEVTDPFSYTRSVASAPWGVQLVPLYNYLNKQIGLVALGKDFSETRATEGRIRAWQLLAALFGVVLMSGAILVVIRGVLLAPLGALNERMSALLKGDASKPADPSDTYCDELRDLADHYERLRSERESSATSEGEPRPLTRIS